MTVIKGSTLGQKHKSFNKLVLDLVNQNRELSDIDYEEPDINNLLKVDVACHTRNVDYLLKVFKCEDMLYISRALKHSTWLFKDLQYANIINPVFLNTHLFPYMLTEAKNKLLYNIRCHIKDFGRSEEFFNFYVEINTEEALRWFLNCSTEFIISKIIPTIYSMPDHTFERLFARSFDLFRIYCEAYKKGPKNLEKGLFLIKTHGDQVFNILDGLSKECLPKFNRKYTKLAMKTCPLRIMFNIQHYKDNIHMQSFVKYINKEKFSEFLANIRSDEDLMIHFPIDRQKKFVECQNANFKLQKLYLCDTDQEQVKDILISFKNNLPSTSNSEKLTFINLILTKCSTHKFDDTMWSIYNDIFMDIDFTKYSVNNKTLQMFLKSVVIYTIIHDKNLPVNIMTKLQFDTFKNEQKKLNEVQKNKLLKLLLKFALLKLDNCDEVGWCENTYILLKQWNKDIKEYPSLLNKIKTIIVTMNSTHDYNGLRNLYLRRKMWRRALLEEEIITNPSASIAYMNILKHNSNILLFDKKSFTISKESKLCERFFRKIRTYWFDSLAKKYKDTFFDNTHKCIFGSSNLLSQAEWLHYIQSNTPRGPVSEFNLEETLFYKQIIRNMHHMYLRPNIDMILLYAKGVHTLETFASFNSILHSMPLHRIGLCMNTLNQWPEFLQKICVWVLFSKVNRTDTKNLIIALWKNTKYHTVRTEIFNRVINYLRKKYSKEEWHLLQNLMDDLNDDEVLIVRRLPYMARSLPITIRSDFCLKTQKLLGTLPPQCGMFLRMPLLKHLSGELHLVNNDVIAEMIFEAITKKMVCSKLNRMDLDVVSSCLSSWKSDQERVEAFYKILAPVLNAAFEVWDVKTVNFKMARYNVDKIVNYITQMYVRCWKTASNPPFVLTALLKGLKQNLSIKENYVTISHLQLAIECFEILLKVDGNELDEDDILEDNTLDIAKMCVRLFCDDLNSYGHHIWKLFYHALQKTLDAFWMTKRTQHKISNCMLDLSKDLSADLDVLVHILVLELNFYKVDDIFGIFGSDDSCIDDDGREQLLDRIKMHPSCEVKANHSKLVLSHISDSDYKEFLYNVHHDYS